MLTLAILGYVELCTVFMDLKILSGLCSLLALLKILKVERVPRTLTDLAINGEWLSFYNDSRPKCVVICVFMFDNFMEFMQMSSLP